MTQPRPAAQLTGALSDFTVTIAKIRAHLESHALLDKAIGGATETPIDLLNPAHPNANDLLTAIDVFRRGRVDEKRILYSTVVLVLFGTFEHFIEQLAHEYLGHLSGLHKYRDLPLTILESHMDGTANIILARNKSRYKSQYRDWKANTLIRQLGSCLAGEDPYYLNLDAFTYRTSNFRLDLVRELFTSLGIPDVLKRISRQQELRMILASKFDEKHIETIPAKSLFSEIDDLAERRNEAAHGPLPENILSFSELDNRIRFVCAFARALNDTCNDALFSIDFELNNLRLPSPILRPSNKVVCFEFVDDQSLTLGSGDLIVAAKNDGSRKTMRIVKIEIQNQTVGRVKWSKGTAIGVEMDENAYQEWGYYVII